MNKSIVERLREASNAFEHLLSIYNNDLRSEGAANSAALVLVHYGPLFNEARQALSTQRGE
jgi:hypothetical protein